MKPSQIIESVYQYPLLTQNKEATNFYIDLLIQMPYSNFIEGFKLIIDTNESKEKDRQTNISIINFNIAATNKSLDVYNAITEYLQQEYLGDEIIDFTFMGGILVIVFQV